MDIRVARDVGPLSSQGKKVINCFRLTRRRWIVRGGEGRVRPPGAIVWRGGKSARTAMRSLRGLTVMITGASRGIGEAIALRVARDGANVVLAGRSTDPAPFAACAMRGQIEPAPSWYSGKMLECAAAGAVPKGHDCMHVTIKDNGVICEPPNPDKICTPTSLANQSLHENASPNLFQEPGGLLDTTDCRFEAVSDRAAMVSGMRWSSDDQYTVKIEGAQLMGYRAITICGTRDPLLISQSEDYLGLVREAVKTKAEAMGVDPSSYKLMFRAYGRDGVMASREPLATDPSHELGILVEVIADTQELANTVLSVARVSTLHLDFPGRLCKEGNMAFPFSPSDIECGPAYRFSVYHIVEPKDALEMFPIDYEDVRN